MESYIGEIRMFAGNFAPLGWALCDGSLLSISDNSTLYALIGTTYGGDDVSTFAVPDFRGRVPMHAQGSVQVGEKLGVEQVQLAANNYPAHSHTITATTATTSTSVPTGNILATLTGSGEMYAGGPAPNSMDATTIGPSTNPGSFPHNNMQPFIALTFIIATAGIYPSAQG
jgi:microcystin-dependent protein